jgi:thiol-disulfide isomerase/thioredoxin
MKRLIALLGMLLLGSCQQPEFFDVQGNGYQIDDLQGKYLIVNYWATWCAPCIKEIPELNALADEFPDQLSLWGVNYDEPEGEEQLRQVAKMKISFPVFRDNPSDQLGVSMPEVLPTTLIFDPQGALIATLVGPQSRESLLSHLSMAKAL